VNWWRDLEPGVRWFIAGGGIGAWALVVAAVRMLARPRRPDPDPTVVDVPGDEPVALASTVADRWSLDRDAVPATVLDLAARGHVSIRLINGQTMIYVPDHRDRHEPFPLPGDENGESLTSYERMVLDRLRKRARLSRDGSVPAEALAHSSRGNARRWWRSFRKAVHQDAERRGLGRMGRPGWARLILITTSLAAGWLVGLSLAAAAFDDSNTGPAVNNSGSDVLWGCGFYGLLLAGVLLFVAFRRPHLRATAEGRQAAARWLGLRDALAADPLLGTLDPAGVSAGGRRLAHAAAMDLAPSAVEPLAGMHRGVKREMWSPVGGQWRQVRLAYPRIGKTSYGMSPGWSIALGGFVLVAMLAPVTVMLATTWSTLFDDDPYLLVMLLLFLVLPMIPFYVFTGATLVRGIRDLTGEPETVEGHVLRVELVREGKRTVWYVVVDDGTRDVLHPWKLNTDPGFGVNARVRAQVSPHLHHVRDVVVLEGGDARSVLDGEIEVATFGMPATSDHPTEPPYEPLASPPTDGAGTDTHIEPGVLSQTAISRIVGRPVREIPDAPDVPEGTVVFSILESAGRIMVRRVTEREFAAMRPRWRRARRTVDGLGDEAYRKFLGGLLIARRGDDAVAIHVLTMGVSSDDAKRWQEAIARHVLRLPSNGEPTSADEPSAGYRFERYQDQR
jgi:predicted membrane protein DUF2207